MTTWDYEYGVGQEGIEGLHRGPYSRDFAERWIQDAENDGSPLGFYILVVRRVSNWREVHG